MTGENPARTRAQELAREALARGEPTAWFERLYREASGDASKIPWAELAPHAALARWLDGAGPLAGARALVVGCGLGDDAAELARRGARVTAFDLSATAIDWCRRRFAEGIAWTVADLLAPPPTWARAFDLVVEVYTLQSMPLDLRARAIASMAGLVAPRGRVVVVTRTRPDEAPPQGPPWPLSAGELAGFEAAGLRAAAREGWDEERATGRAAHVLPGGLLAVWERAA
jgi:SAM-dependent methyltransferase